MTFSELGRRRGQATLEFALILPILLVMLGITFEMGRYTYMKQSAINVSRQVAMLATRRIDPASLTNFPNAIAAAATIASPIDLTNNGRIYVGQVMRRASDNQPQIIQYDRFGSLNAPPKTLTGGINGIASLPAHVVLESNSVLYVVETYFRFVPVMRFAFAGLSSQMDASNLVYAASYF